MDSPRDILELMDKHQLVDLIMEYSDNFYFPLELFLLQADYPYSRSDLERLWGDIYSQALEYDENDISKGADYLADMGKLVFKRIKDLKSKSDQRLLCDVLIADLERASTDDGIGMGGDAEWLYDEVREQIQDYLESIQ